MAWTQGRATDYLDLMAKLKNFVTDASLLGSQVWTVNRWDAVNGELIVTGPGLAGLDEIVVGMKNFSDLTQDYYNWRINGFIGYNQSSAFESQPGAIKSRVPIVPLWNKEIPFWFVANGRRIIIIAKVGLNYEAMYLGLLKSYCPPGIFPYPLIVGGSLTDYNGSGSQTSQSFYRWDNNTQNHRHFLNAGYSGGNSESNYADSALRLRKIDGSWVGGANFASSDSPSLAKMMTWPYGQALTTTSNTTIIEGQTPNFDGSYPIFPIMLLDNTPNAYGEFDGCYYIPGIGLSPEDTIAVGEEQYLVIPNVFRMGVYDYWVLKLA